MAFKQMPRVVERALPMLTQDLVDGALNLEEPSPTPSPRPTIAPLVPRGGVVDIAPEATSLTVNTSWHASDSSPAEVDVVAFLLNGDELVSSDEDFVFYNAPATSEGSVALTIDGDSEQGVRIDLSVVPSECERIVVAAAIEGERTFGDVGAVSVCLDSPESALATAVLDAATTERTLMLAEIYRRNGTWRFRAIGQGYDDGLAELAVRYGVEVDG